VYTPSGGGGGEVDTYGNNFAAAIIFADGYGINAVSGDPKVGIWTKVVSDIDYNTGLRPVSAQVLPDGVELPYLDPLTTHVLEGVTYYKQKTASTWQGEWKNGEDTDQNVTAAWGDNLISQNLTVNSVIRVEMVLTKALDTNMTSYNMVSLYGTNMNEIYGTDGVEYNSTTAFVFATNARLTIQKVEDNGTLLQDPLYSQALGEGDGPGYFAAEVNVAGNFTYGFVWLLNELDEATLGYSKAGTWRITFSLDNTSVPTGAPNNTFIDTAVNGVLDNPASVHIDINIGQ
jgi:hypothetical protein